MSVAALVSPLALVGSRKADGSVNASGRVWFFQPGTATQQVVYADADASITLTQPITLDAAGKATVYITDPARVLVEYLVSTGAYATVDDFTAFYSANAKSVGVRTTGFMGVNAATGSSVSGGDTTLDAVLRSAFASTQGVDFQYLESAGATARTIHDKFQEIWISTKDFGAVNNGIADDTAAIQAAINRVGALGGGTVYLGPGTPHISAALTNTSKNGVSIVGAGPYATIVTQTVGAANTFTFTSCNGFTLRDFGISHTATTTGAGMAMSACSNVLISNVALNTATHKYGVDVSGASAYVVIQSSILNQTGASSRAVRINTTGGLARAFYIVNSTLSTAGGSDALVEFNGSVTDSAIVNCNTASGTTGVLFNSALTGSRFTVAFCPRLSAFGTAFDMSGLSSDVSFRQYGNQVDGYVAADVTSGGTFTPNRLKGRIIKVRGTTAGAAYIVAAPTPPPEAVSYWEVHDLTFELVNAVGGGTPVTGWDFATSAKYKIASAISTVDANITMIRFEYDHQSSLWREVCRAVTT